MHTQPAKTHDISKDRTFLIHWMLAGIIASVGFEEINFLIDNINDILGRSGEPEDVPPTTEKEVVDILQYAPSGELPATQSFLINGKRYWGHNNQPSTPKTDLAEQADYIIRNRTPQFREYLTVDNISTTYKTCLGNDKRIARFAEYLAEKYSSIPPREAKTIATETAKCIASSIDTAEMLDLLFVFYGITPTTKRQCDELSRYLWPVFNSTHRWILHGHSQLELAEKKILSRHVITKEQLSSQVSDFIAEYIANAPDVAADVDDCQSEEDEADDEENAEREEKIKELIKVLPDLVKEMLPDRNLRAKPFDFKLAKNQEWRQSMLEKHMQIQILVCKTVSNLVKEELRKSDIKRARKTISVGRHDEDDILQSDAEIYAMMLDDSSGEPPIYSIMRKKSDSENLDDKALQIPFKFLETYRFTCLEIEAIRSGLGFKCKDLFSGEEFFLVDTGFSDTTDFKGCALYAGIFAFSNVYGVLGPAKVILKRPAAQEFAQTLKAIGIQGTPPKEIHYSLQARLAQRALRGTEDDF